LGGGFSASILGLPRLHFDGEPFAAVGGPLGCPDRDGLVLKLRYGFAVIEDEHWLDDNLEETQRGHYFHAGM
jgi:hypothetical protein